MSNFNESGYPVGAFHFTAQQHAFAAAETAISRPDRSWCGEGRTDRALSDFDREVAAMSARTGEPVAICLSMARARAPITWPASRSSATGESTFSSLVGALMKGGMSYLPACERASREMPRGRR